MKANELRLGNYVDVAAYENEMVVSITPSEIITINGLHWDIDDDIIKPIAITPQILYKAGFEIDDSVHSNCTAYKLKRHSFMVAAKQGKFWYYNYCDEDDHYSSFWPELKYFHQLQNFFFAYTGQELLLGK